MLVMKVRINNLAILIDCPLLVVLIAIDLHNYLVDEKGVTVASVIAFQAPRIFLPTLIHHSLKVSWLTVIPCLARRSSINDSTHRQ
jgi:hypothetical protein